MGGAGRRSQNDRVIQESRSAGGRVRVLIADDQPAFLDLLREMLAGLAGEVFECQDGAAAVRLFERHQPDWTLLDWNMPVLDGLAAARVILKESPRARVILLSLHVTPALSREALEAGVRACLGKHEVPSALDLIRPTPGGGEPLSIPSRNPNP